MKTTARSRNISYFSCMLFCLLCLLDFLKYYFESLIITYHPGLLPFRSILGKHSSILNVSKGFKQFAERNPPLLAYQRPPNLRTLLVRATIKQKHHLSYNGISRCRQTHCKACHHIKPIKGLIAQPLGKHIQSKPRQIVKQPLSLCDQMYNM